MPVSLLGAERLARYGRYANDPSREQLARFFRFEGDDLAFVVGRHGDHNRLGIAVQLATVRFLGRFLPDPRAVPPAVAEYVAGEIGVRDPRCLARYAQGREANRHRKHARAICERYGYRSYAHARGGLLEHLRARCEAAAERPSVIFDLASGWLREHRVLLPGATTLERDVAQVRDRAERELWATITAAVDGERRRRLEQLLTVPYGSGMSGLERLRRAPTSISASGLVGALARLREIRALDVGHLDAGGWPASRIAALARYGATAKAQAIAQLTADRRTATLVATARHLEVCALDDALDLFDQLLERLLGRVQRAGGKARAGSLERLDKAARQLREVALIVASDEHADLQGLRVAVFAAVPREQMLAAARAVDELARPREDTEAEQLLARYAFVRQFLPAVLDTITFDAAPAGRLILDALAVLRRLERRKRIQPAEVSLDVLNGPWALLAVRADGTLDRRAYTLGVLEQLRLALRRRDIFAPGAERWGDPRRRLLEGHAWERARPEVCRALELPHDPNKQLEIVSAQLDEAYQYAAQTIDPAIIQRQDATDRLCLPDLDNLPEPASLRNLRRDVWELVPPTELPALLLEVHEWTGLLDAFQPIGGAKRRIVDIDVSVCAALIAEACNIGLEPLLDRTNPALSRDPAVLGRPELPARGDDQRRQHAARRLPLRPSPGAAVRQRMDRLR